MGEEQEEVRKTLRNLWWGDPLVVRAVEAVESDLLIQTQSGGGCFLEASFCYTVGLGPLPLVFACNGSESITATSY